MSNRHIQQAAYNYLHNTKELDSSMLRKVKGFFNKCNFPKREWSRKNWYKHYVNKHNKEYGEKQTNQGL